MDNIKDLNIEKEILPIFNYSLNKYTEQRIADLLKNPLSTISEIKFRQRIFEGFSENESILNEYSYTVLYFNQVYALLKNFNGCEFPKNRVKYKLAVSKKKRSQNRSRFSLLIIFFHRLYTKYFSILKLSPFPPKYRSNIEQIISFLSTYNLNKYEAVIREKELTSKHLFEIIGIIKYLKKQGEVQKFWENLFLFEAFLSINKGFIKGNYTFPRFSDTFTIQLHKFYHPALNNPVVNNLTTKNNILILNGPNMSGKSTLLKAVGVCIYLGHLGFAIPAKSAIIPLFQNFFIKINQTDDILNGYSHFMTEILNLKKVVNSASKNDKVFAVFDELFSATNADDAFQISQITLNGLSRFKNSFFLVSTHIQKLKDFTDNTISNYHLSGELKAGEPVFTYKLEPGWSDLKVGKILFELEGLIEILKGEE